MSLHDKIMNIDTTITFGPTFQHGYKTARDAAAELAAEYEAEVAIDLAEKDQIIRELVNIITSHLEQANAALANAKQHLKDD